MPSNSYCVVVLSIEHQDEPEKAVIKVYSGFTSEVEAETFIAKVVPPMWKDRAIIKSATYKTHVPKAYKRA